MNGVRITEALMETARKAGLDGDERVQRRIRLAARTGNGRYIERLHRALAAGAVERIVSQYRYHVPNSAEEVAGPIEIGRDAYMGYRVGFDAREGHILEVGATQFGKTNCVGIVISQIIGRIPFWAFDIKRDLRHLIRQHPTIYPIRLDRGLKFNPLRPFGEMPVGNWNQTFFDQFCQGEELLRGSETFGLELLDRLADTHRSRPPTMFDFLALAKDEMSKLRSSSVRGKYAERLATRLESVVSIFGDVYDCAVGFPLQELARENIVFEADGIETGAAQLQIRSLLSANYHWRMETGQRGDEVTQFIIVDEAQTTFSPLDERKYASGIPFIDLMVQRSREFGMVYLVCNQNTRLAYAIKENSRVKISFNLCDGYDRTSMARTMALTQEQCDGIGSLQVGEALVEFAGRCPKAIKVRMDHFPFDKDVTNEEVARHTEPFLQRLGARVVPSERVRREARGSEEEAGQFTWHEETLLRHIGFAPALDWTGRTEALKSTYGIGDAAARKARERLVRRGLVEEVRVRKAPKRGSSFVGLVLTPKGRDHLRAQGERVGNGGRGQAEHCFWAAAAKAFYEAQGCTCEVEADIAPGVLVDVLVSGQDSRRVAVEVELSSKTVVRNIEKLFGLGLDAVVIAVDGGSLLDEVQAKAQRDLGAEALTGVSFVPVQAFLEPPGEAQMAAGSP